MQNQFSIFFTVNFGRTQQNLFLSNRIAKNVCIFDFWKKILLKISIVNSLAGCNVFSSNKKACAKLTKWARMHGPLSNHAVFFEKKSDELKISNWFLNLGARIRSKHYYSFKYF